jgi:hypothetical protein
VTSSDLTVLRAPPYPSPVSETTPLRLSVIVDSFWSSLPELEQVRRNVSESLAQLRKLEIPFELLLVASRDPGLKEVGLRLVLAEGQGGYARKSLGFREAGAGIVVFLDGDCVPHEDFFPRILKTFSEKPDLKALAGSVVYAGQSFLSRVNSVLSFGPLFDSSATSDRGFICNTNSFSIRKGALPDPLFGPWQGRVNGDVFISQWLYDQGTPIELDPAIRIRHADPSTSFVALLERHFREYLRNLRDPRQLLPWRLSAWRMLRSFVYSFRDRLVRFRSYSGYFKFSPLERAMVPLVFLFYVLLDSLALLALIVWPPLARRWFSYQEGRAL